MIRPRIILINCTSINESIKVKLYELHFGRPPAILNNKIIRPLNPTVIIAYPLQARIPPTRPLHGALVIRLLDVDRRQPGAGAGVLLGLYLAGRVFRCEDRCLFLQLSVGAGVFVGGVEDAFSEVISIRGAMVGTQAAMMMVLDSMLSRSEYKVLV